MPPGVSPTLRPLGIGELLDRAVTLCVRRFWALAAIYVGFAALLEVLQVLDGNDRALLVNAVTKVLQNQAAGKSGSDLFATFSQYQSTGSWTFALLAVSFLLMPLPFAAMIASAGAFYRGSSLSLGEAYRAGARAWPSLIALGFLYFMSGMGVYLVVVLFVVIVAFGMVLLATFSKALVLVLGVVLGLALLVAFLIAGALVALAYQVSTCSCVLEGKGPLSAFQLGLRRVFSRGGVGRAILVGCAYFAIFIGIGIVDSIAQGVLLGFIKNVVLSSIFAVAISVASGAFGSVFIVLFYFDLRVREEGLDLQAAASALPADAPAAI